jgi:hypothetical protein
MPALNLNAGAGDAMNVGVTLTPADVNVIARALFRELATECARILASPLPNREDVARIRTLLDVYEGQIEMLGWGVGLADVKLDCPTNKLDTVADDLLCFAEEGSQDHRVTVCALLEHFLTELQGKQAA